MQPSSSFVKFKVPLVQTAYKIAEQFSLRQKDSQKAKQVYFNSLAVYAVRFYMKCMGVETDWEKSESWDLVTQTLLDVADLDLPGLGKLECRPVLPENESVYIPLDVHEDRIGYVVVQVDSSLDQATLLGFMETAPKEELSLNQLQPLEDLPGHLDNVRQAKLTKTSERLSQWFENIFDVDWLSVPALFSRVANPAFNARSSNLLKVASLVDSTNKISRGKIIDLGIQIIGYPLALIVTITPVTNEEIDILAQVYPAGGQLILPKNLQLIVRDEAEENSMEVQARDSDNWIQLEFSGEKNERFSINVALDNFGITEYFVI